MRIDPTGSAINLLLRCKRTSVSRLVVKLHSLYRLRLVRRTPYVCSPAVDGSLLIVAVRECIVVLGTVSASRPIWALCCCIGAE